MSTLKNKSGLTEAEVQSGMEFADAAQYLARGRAYERAREVSREVLRGNIDTGEAAEIQLAETLATGTQSRCPTNTPIRARKSLSTFRASGTSIFSIPQKRTWRELGSLDCGNSQSPGRSIFHTCKPSIDGWSGASTLGLVRSGQRTHRRWAQEPPMPPRVHPGIRQGSVCRHCREQLPVRQGP